MILRIKYIFLILYAVVFATSFTFPTTTFALVVDFEETPLFTNANITPGDSVTRAVLVENDTNDTQSVYVFVENTFNDGLADVMSLTVTDGSTTYYSGTFTDFFNTTPVVLSTLLTGVDTTYVFTASLPDSIDNSYQLSTFGFDLTIGFVDGATQSTSGGGGKGSAFRITNEQIDSVNTVSDGVTITWNTNRKSSSYLICGNTEDGPFEINSSDSNLGYPLSVLEVGSDTNIHSMTISGLSEGSYECRPASRRNANSTFTIGDTLTFRLLTRAVAGISTTAEMTDPIKIPQVPTSLVLGVESDTNEEPVTLIASSSSVDSPDVIEEQEQPLADITSSTSVDESENCTYIWLIILTIMTFIWTVIDDRILHQSKASKQMFFKNSLFAVSFGAVVWWLNSSMFMDIFGWLFGATWLGMYMFDYLKHSEDSFWNSTLRHLFFGITSTFLVISSIVLNWPCQWWPFMVVVVGSSLLWLTRKN